MLDPVVTCDGQTYERAQIERWFDSQRPGRYTSPMSNARLTHRNTIPNYALRMAIQEYIRAIDPDSSEQAPEPIAIQAFRPQAPPADSPDSIAPPPPPRPEAPAADSSDARSEAPPPPQRPEAPAADNSVAPPPPQRPEARAEDNSDAMSEAPPLAGVQVIGAGTAQINGWYTRKEAVEGPPRGWPNDRDWTEWSANRPFYEKNDGCFIYRGQFARRIYTPDAVCRYYIMDQQGGAPPALGYRVFGDRARLPAPTLEVVN